MISPSTHFLVLSLDICMQLYRKFTFLKYYNYNEHIYRIKDIIRHHSLKKSRPVPKEHRIVWKAKYTYSATFQADDIIQVDTLST